MSKQYVNTRIRFDWKSVSRNGNRAHGNRMEWGAQERDSGYLYAVRVVDGSSGVMGAAYGGQVETRDEENSRDKRRVSYDQSAGHFFLDEKLKMMQQMSHSLSLFAREPFEFMRNLSETINRCYGGSYALCFIQRT